MVSKLLSGFSLSPVQQRLWHIAEADGHSPYRVGIDFETVGIDADTLEKALTDIVRRHEILHMEFGVLPGSQLPVQAPDENPAAVAATALPDADAGFQMHLQHLGGNRYRLSLSALCADAQSLLLILEEMAAQLQSGLDTAEAENCEEELPFTSLAQWQHDMLNEAQELKLPVWSKTCSRHRQAPLPSLPFVRKAALGMPSIKRHPLDVPPVLQQQLASLAQQLQMPLANLLYAAWSVLLHRLQSDGLTVAYLASGRAYDEVQQLIGPLARFVPLDLPLQTAAHFSAQAARFNDAIEETLGLQDSIFPQPENFCADAGFSWQPLTFDNPRIKTAMPFAWTDKLLILLSASPLPAGQLQLCFDYDESCCEPEAIATLQEELFALLADIVLDPHRRVADLAILGLQERLRVLHEFQGPVLASAQPWQAPVHALRARLLAAPDSIAVQSSEGGMTGREFVRRMDAISRRILSGQRPAIIGVLLPRSIDMAASLLAIQQSGAAYVPLDTAYPAHRVAFMLEDSGARLLITSADIAAKLRRQTLFQTMLAKLSVVIVDEIELSSTADLELPALAAEDLAYLIYTSGSTGVPKGVAVPHRALANHMQWMLKDLPLFAHDAVLLKTAISFDASVWELFAPLMAGARLVLAAPGIERDPEQLLACIEHFNITVLQLVPSMLRVLVENEAFPQCRSLRRLCCGGEMLDAELAGKTLALLPAEAELVNLYGPTETTIQVVAGRIRGSDQPVPIGKPIDNSRVYVLDENLHPQPIGVRGEIYIAGECLAQGYHRREALTDERFVADPFAAACSDRPPRMYRSGDIGAWRSDGRLDCFGRADRQVKLRGYRIELGEIESVVSNQPGVLTAAVLVDRDASDIDQLLCYYTLKAGATLPAETVKQALAAQLPDYMLPNWLIPIDAFPLMPNGKIDTKALLKLRPANTAVSQAPRDTLEMRLERIWESVLHISQVGINSNFFDMGGHSLLAVRLMAEIEKEFGHRLPLTSLFSASTIEAQAALLRNERLDLDTILVPIRSGNPDRSPLVLVHPTGGSVLCYRDLASGLTTDRAIFALQDPGLAGDGHYDSVEGLAALYLDKIQPLVCDNRYLLAGWSSGGIIAYEMARQALARGFEIVFLGLIDSQVSPVVDRSPDRERLVRAISRLIAHKAELVCPDLSGLDFDTALQHLLELARKAEFVPPYAEQQDIEKLFRVFEKNVSVIGRYTAGPLPRRTVVMKATDALPDGIREAAVHYSSEDKNLGWDKLCFAKVRDVAGDHVSIMDEPRVAGIVKVFDHELREVERLHTLDRQKLIPMLGW